MKVWKSGAYTLTSRIVSVLVTTVSLAFLGRLISPEEFGVFGLAYAVFSILRPLLDLGLTPAYLKLEEVDEDVSDTFFTFNAVIGLLIGLLLAFSAHVIADFYQKPILFHFVLFFSASVFLESLSCQPQAVLTRKKCFDTLSFLRLSTLFVGVSSCIFLAYLGFGYWALVFRVVLEAFYKAVLSIWLSKQSYRLVGLKKARRFVTSLRFSSQIIIGRVLAGLSGALPDMVVGRVLNPLSVGLYTRATALATMPDATLRVSLTTPALSYFSRLKHQAKVEHYVALSWVVFVIAGVPCLLFVVIGDWLMPWVMGPQWVESGKLLQWLGVWGIGKLYHGLSVIYHMDQKRMSRWISLVTWSIPVIYLMPFYLLIQYRDLSLFVAVLAVCYSLFWVFAYFYIMGKDLKAKNECNVAFFKQAGMTCALVLSGFFLKEHVVLHSLTSSSSLSSLKAISSVSLPSVVLATFYLAVVAKAEFFQIKRWLYRS